MLRFCNGILWILLVYSYDVTGELSAYDRPVVTIAQGTLRGTYLTSSNGRYISAFMSLPFASPPLGNLRFKAPLKAKGWKGVRDASKDAGLCIQDNPYIRMKEIVGSEDCLYLNVYSPKKDESDKTLLPVMVFFHGGGWVCGSGNKEFYGPERLLDRDVVYVGVNYRLGPLGFFSTMDAACPGNNALKDQAMALRWIKDNIEKFGGDSNLVTIFGESAGGASVHYHMMSPLSKGLFHRGISHSGVALNMWANAVPGITEKRAIQFALAMNCPTDDSFAMVDCLREKAAEDLISVTSIFNEWDYDPMIPFKPVVEYDHDGAFLTEDPRVLLDEGKFYQVPWITGFNEKEGAIISARIFGIPGLREELSNDFDRIAPITFDYNSATDINHVTKTIKDYYLGGQTTITNDTTHPLTDIYTDSYFLAGFDEALTLQLPNAKYPIYVYYYKYRGSNSFTKIFGDPWRNYGTCHVDELINIFQFGFFPDGLNAEDAKVSDTFLTLWMNFAISGNPNIPNKPQFVKMPEWKELTSMEEMEHLEISKTLTAGTRLLEERREIWKNLPLWQRRLSAVYNKKLKRTEL